MNSATRPPYKRQTLLGLGRRLAAVTLDGAAPFVPASATKGLPVLNRRHVPFLPWNLSEEKKKELGKAGLPYGDDTS